MGTNIVDQKYFVNEYFYSLQGEGVYSGKAAFFIRLSGCRVCCPWCDSRDSWTMNSGKEMTVNELLLQVKESGASIVVITGGEPMLHKLDSLTKRLKTEGLRLHLETSGSEEFSGVFDWITLSPKRGKECRKEYFAIANELKVVIEKEEDFERAEHYSRQVDEKCTLLLQSEWSVREKRMPEIIEFIKKNNKWGLSLQTHKFMNVR